MPRIIRRPQGIPKTLAYEDYCMTQQEVADSLGMTRPMVGLVEQRAKAKIRKLLAEKNIKVSDLLEAM